MIDKLFRKGRWRVTALVAVSLVALVGGVYWWWAHTPLPLPQTPREGLAAIGSVRYENMPDYRRREYRTEIFRQVNALPEEEARAVRAEWEVNPAVREEMRGNFMQDRAREYAMASPMERAVIDAMIPMMGGRGPRGGGGDAGTPQQQAERRKQRKEEMEERMKEMFQSGNPQVTGWIGEFFKRHREMFERREREREGERG